jgi:hypothetical protein
MPIVRDDSAMKEKKEKLIEIDDEQMECSEVDSSIYMK